MLLNYGGLEGPVFKKAGKLINFIRADAFNTLGADAWRTLAMDLMAHRLKIAPGNEVDHRAIVA